MTTHRIVTMLIGLSIAGLIFLLLRKDRLHPTYSFWWITVAVLIVVFGFFPNLIDVVGGALGIGYPPILALIVGFGLVLIKILTMDMERSRQENQIRILTQRLAIYERLEKEGREIREEAKDRKS